MALRCLSFGEFSGSEEAYDRYLQTFERVCFRWIEAFENVKRDGGDVPAWNECYSCEGGRLLLDVRPEAGEVSGDGGAGCVRTGTQLGGSVAGGSCGDGVTDGVDGTCTGGFGSPVGSGNLASGGGGTAGVPVSEKTLRNRERRHARAEKKRERKAGLRDVPEWRRKGAKAPFHRGVFSDCSSDVQRELRESRAKMLIAKNSVAVVEAEHRRRTVEARLKARVVEEEVERRRLELVEVNRKAVEARLAKQPPGYAETVASLGLESVLGTPSLSIGSVSPDSSISVAELKRKEVAMEMLVSKVAELSAVVDSYKEKEALQSTGFKRSGEVHVKDGYSRDNSPVRLSCATVVPSVGRQRMSSLERARRERFGLPLKGPGSGMDGYGRWD